MNILLSILSQDTKQEHSRLVSLPVVPNPGQIVMVGQTKLVVQSLILQADSDEIQAMSESHAVSNAADLVKAGWKNTQDEPYHEAKKPVQESKIEIEVFTEPVKDMGYPKHGLSGTIGKKKK